METKASYMAVGGFLLAFILAAALFLLWLGRVELVNKQAFYNIYFKETVTGLKDGSQVLYRGVPIGVVKDIAIDPKNVEMIRVHVGIKSGTPIKEDSIASLEMQGITGISIIQIHGGTRESPILLPKAGEEYAVIPSKASGLQKLFNSMPKLVSNANELVKDFSKLLDENNREAVTEIILNIRDVTHTLSERREDIDQLIDKSSIAMTRLSSVMKTLEDKSPDTMDDIQMAAQSFSNAADGVEEIVSENRSAIRDFFNRGLYELSNLMVQMKNTLATIGRLSGDVEKGPLNFLFESPSEGYHLR